MTGRENLGPGVKEVVDKLKDPRSTVDLKDLLPDDKLTVIVGDKPRDVLDFTIVTPAKEELESVNDSAYAMLPGWKWSSKCAEEDVKILIGGSCTYNPGSPLGFTMLSMGKISVGRNLILWLGETDECTIFKTPIKEMFVSRDSS